MHEGGAWSVMQQRRWVSYIYRYREFVRCEIAGFIKVQRISNKDTDVTRIRMGMKMYKEYACTCYAYLLWHGQAKPFTAVQFAAGERDTILTSVELPWSNPLGDGVAFPEYDGVYFVCDDGEILAGIWSTERYDLRQVQVTDRQDGLVEQEEPVLEYAGAGWREDCTAGYREAGYGELEAGREQFSCTWVLQISVSDAWKGEDE